MMGGGWRAMGGGTWSVLLVSQGKKWLYWNTPDSRPGLHLTSPTTWVTIFNWSPYIQLQNSKLNLSNFRVTSTFNKEINYACIGWHSSLEWIDETKKIEYKWTEINE